MPHPGVAISFKWVLPSATLALEAATGSRVPCIDLHPYQAYHSGDVSSAGQRWANSRPLPSHRADRRGRKEALKIVDQTGYRRGRGYTLQGLADLLLSQDQLEAAGKTAEEAQAIRRDLREENNLALSNMQMAVIHLEQGRLTEPEPLVRAAIDTFERAKLIESGATAHAVLTRVLLAQGKVGDAQSAARRALTLSRHLVYRPPRFDAALASARVRAATGKSKDALQNLHATVTEATKFGYLPYQFEARLAIGQIEMQSGKSSAGRPHLETLEKDARAKAYFLIARKAAAAAKVSR